MSGRVHLHRRPAAHQPWIVRFFEHPHGPGFGGLVHFLVQTGSRLVVPAALLASSIASAMLVRSWERRRLVRSATTYELRLPAEFDRARFAQTCKSLAPALRGGLVSPSIAFELRAEAGRPRSLVVAAGIREERLRRLIGEAIPGARLDLVTDEVGPAMSPQSVRSFAATARDGAPLQTEFVADPIGLLLRSLGDTGEGEIVALQLLVTAAPRRARRRLLSEATRLRTGKRRRSLLELGLLGVLFVLQAVWEVFDRAPTSSASTQTPRQPAYVDRERVNALMAKARQPLFACSLRVAANAPTPGIARALLAGAPDDLEQYRSPFSGLRRTLELFARRRFVRRLLPLRPPLLLSGSELATLLPVPANAGESPVPMARTPARELAPAAAAPRSGIRLGTSDARGRQEPVFISPRSLLQHVHLLGATGAGKSTALLNLAVEAMNRDLGLLVLEPKGDLIADVLKHVPQRRVEDVTLLDFGDRGFPPAFNLLAGSAGQAEAVAAIFSRVFGGNWGPRSDDLLRAALMTLEGGTGDGAVPTLAEVLPLLADPRRRRRYRFIDRVVLPVFWKMWDSMSEGQRQQALAPLSNKLRALLLRPAVRDALVQPEAPDLRAVIADRRIVLCSLPTGTEVMGEDGASLFGSVLMHRLWQAAQSLGPSKTRSPFLCLVDEAHRFTALPGGMSEVLSQARGYGLGFVLAHQQLIQLPAELREAVAVNCRTKLCFQLDPPDNERMARHFEPRLDDDDLLLLDRYQLACRIVEDGLVLPPVTATATPPPEEPVDAFSDLIHLRKRLTTRSKAEVEALIAERFPELEPPLGGEVALDTEGPPIGTPGGTPDVPPDVPRLPPNRASDSESKNSDSSDDEGEDRPWAA